MTSLKYNSDQIFYRKMHTHTRVTKSLSLLVKKLFPEKNKQHCKSTGHLPRSDQN